MTVRAFEWRDLVALHAFRSQSVYLDSARVLTTGPIFVPAGALLSGFSPRTSFFTAVQQAENDPSLLFGQVSHVNGAASARFSFLTPLSSLKLDSLAEMVEFLVPLVGERGPMHLVGEVEEHTQIQNFLRQTGFGVYARQRIWRLEQPEQPETGKTAWRAAGRQDEAAIRFLYASLVPGLVQQVESLPAGHLHGLVYYRGTELLAYVDLTSGLNGVYAVPFIHPDAEGTAEQLFHLLGRMPGWRSRPVYVCVRSYQSWLDFALEELMAAPGQYQAVMVRRLAARRIAPVHATHAINGSSTETTIPVARLQRDNL